MAPLAALRGDPILLSTRDELPEASRAALAGRDGATIVGGEAAVSAAVEGEVGELVGVVERAAGATRFDTAVRVAALAEQSGASAARTTVATGGSFADALVAGPVVAGEEGVLLLVPQSSLDDTPSVAAYLDARRDVIQRIRVLGGAAAISEAVTGELRALLER